MALDKLTKIQKIGINTTTIPTVGGVEGVGVITATNFIGDGSGLTGVTASGSGVIVKDDGTLVGTAQTIDFGTNLNISPVSAGIVTITNAASATSLTGLSDVTISSPSNGQILKYNGSVFVNAADTGANTTYSQSSVASGSNVNLRLTDSDGTSDDILITAGSNITFSSISANGFTIASSGGGSGTLSNIVEDTTPQLGGSLDLNNKFITGSGGINVSGAVTATSFAGNGANITAVNATTLDSIDSGSFLRSDATDTCSGQVTFTNQIIAKQDGVFATQTGVALVVSNSTNTNMRGNHFIIDDFPSGGGTYFIQATESGVTNDRNLVLQGYAGKVGIGITNPSERLDVNGNVKATSFIGNGAVLSGVVTSIVAGANITLTGGPTGIVTIASSGGGGGGGISLSNGVDNRVVTAVGATVVNGEANLTFDGTTLALTGSQTTSGSIVVGSAVTVNSTGIDVIGIVTATSFSGSIAASNVDSGTLSTDRIPSLATSKITSGTFDAARIPNLAASKITSGTFDAARIPNLAASKITSGTLDRDTTGNAATATEATNITVSANNNTDETVYPVFVDGTTGTQGAETDTGLTYNPNTGNLTATKFTGDGSGLTGVSGSGSGIVIKHDDSTVGTAGTINFGTNLDVSAISAGIVTVTASGSSNISLSGGVNNRVVTAVSASSVQGESDLTFDGTSLGIAGGSTDGVVIEQGGIKIRNGGSVSYVDFYCESNNAHRVRLQSPAHSTFSGNPNIVLPNTSGNLAVLSNASNNRVITASGAHEMNGEANLTFNGSTLSVTGSVSATSFSGSGASLTSLPAANLTGNLPAISGASLINLPTIAGVWAVSNYGSSYYVISGPGGLSSAQNPTLYLVRGQTYQFNMSASGHGFGIQTVDGAWTGNNSYTTGITNAGASTGTITFAVPYNAPARLYYACTSFHSNMHGDIYIRGANGDEEGVGDISATSFSGSIAASNVDSGTLGTARIPNLAASKITSGTLDAARIPNLGAAKITSGTLDAARIPDLGAAKITSGTFDAARIPSLNASKINAGTLDAARIPDLGAAKITSGTLDADRIPDLGAAKITSGTLDADRIPDLGTAKITSGTFDAARIPNLNANKITAGTLGTARIPNLAASKITSGTFDAARIPSLNASKITAGTFDAARIPTLNQDTTGNAATADTSTHVTVTDNESTNEENLITFVEDATSTTGSVGLEMDGNLTYNPSSGTLTATKFSGSGEDLTGLTASQIPNLAASKITSGTLDAARIPNLAASKITSGAFDAARIPNLAASKITSGTFDAARIPTLNQDTTGNAATADKVDTIKKDDLSTGYLTFVADNNTNATAETVFTATGITVDSSADKITATTFVGDLTGDVTGNISGSSGSCSGNAAGLSGTPDITVDDLTVNGNTTLGNATSDTVTINGDPTIINDSGLIIRTTTNGAGAKINFSDHAGGSYAQNGTITYKHADGTVTTTGGNSDDGWIFEGSETRTVVKVVGDIEATSNLYVGEAANISSDSVTFNIPAGTTITPDETAVGSCSAIEYTIFVSNGSNIQSQKVLIMDNGTTAYIQEYAVMSNPNHILNFTTDINSGKVRLRATPESGISGSTTIKFSKMIID